MRNILFSTTRQWNVGDEFILFGTISLIKEAFSEKINPIIYNRHPDLRTDVQPISGLRDVKLHMADKFTSIVDANFRFGFRDNSFKRTVDGEFIDLVVFAGTPEWSNSRCFDLYEIIEKYDLPVIALGIGCGIQDENELILRNLNRFSLFTVRAPEFVEPLRNYLKITPEYLPCPSLCSAEPSQIRTVQTVKHIGLIYSCDVARSENSNCISAPAYEYLVQFYRELRKKYPKYSFSLVCHYINELPYAYSDFPDMEIHYSFDAKDYYDIYNRFDLVIGPRVHGIGCAASMGIPGICISHDFRAETVKGFFSETVTVGQPIESVFEVFEHTISTIHQRNTHLVEHIKRTRACYLDLLHKFVFPVKRSDRTSPDLRMPINNILEVKPYLDKVLRELWEAQKQGAAASLYYREADAEYIEENCLTAADVELSGEYVFQLKPGVSNVRFDPAERMNCVISDLVITCGEKQLDPQWTNGLQYEGKYYFFTDDPQIEIPLPLERAEQIRIRAKIEPLSIETRDELISQMKSRLDEYENLSGDLAWMPRKIRDYILQKFVVHNYFDDLDNRIEINEFKFGDSPRKAALRMIWWNFKSLFKIHRRI